MQDTLSTRIVSFHSLGTSRFSTRRNVPGPPTEIQSNRLDILASNLAFVKSRINEQALLTRAADVVV